MEEATTNIAKKTSKNDLRHTNQSIKLKKSRRLFNLLLAISIVCKYIVYARLCIKKTYALISDEYELPFQVYILVFHTHFVLFIWSLMSAMVTSPGSVPKYWGFYVGDEARRMRYCGICKIWKPDRTHHCSQCNVCVLNMDHHCPWINNCVGFYNRKFFIQILFYATILLFCTSLHSLTTINNISEASGAAFIFIISMILLIGIIPFTRFHWRLLVTNSTTIESLDVRAREHARFDLGSRRNIEQVFGTNPMLWWLPLHLKWSAPDGDGVRWRRHYLKNYDTTIL